MKAEPLQYTVEEIENLPPKVKEESEKAKGGASDRETVVIVDERTYIIVSLGKRPTGGYSVNVSKVEQRGDTLHVYAEEKTPATGSMVIQVISYPMTVISVKGTYTNEDVEFHVRRAESR